MNFFRKLFGKKETKAPAPQPESAPPPTPADPAKDPNLIRVQDGYGKEFLITREDWNENVLKPNLEAGWDTPERLYPLIVAALNNGFRRDILPAAQRLAEIDVLPQRGTCLWGIILMEEGRFDEARTLLETFTAQRGENGVILTNLAKIYAKQGDATKAEAVLWHALEVDPNQENGLAWYVALHREREGDAAALEACGRVAAVSGSWRAQLWMARTALEGRDLPKALALYETAFARMQPVPTDALMQISSDLGNNGHLVEILNVVGPRFDIREHGMAVGNNLIKAHLDLGQLDAARSLVDQLYAQNRPDWKQLLSYWDLELAKARLATASPINPEKIKVALLTIDGPVWLKPTSSSAELFPLKDSAPVRVAFLGSSVEQPTDAPSQTLQVADSQGRLSRAVPLFLTEQLDLGSNARCRTLVPWVVNGPGGFVVAGKAWAGDQAASYARSGEEKSDFVVVTHIQTGNQPWHVEFRLIRTIDAACVGEGEVPIYLENPAPALDGLLRQLMPILTNEAGIRPRHAPEPYAIPGNDQMAIYLLRLEQLLAVRCAATNPGGGEGSVLTGEREILEGHLQLCLAYPKSISIRILMAQTFWTMRHVRRAILPEFRSRLELLQHDHPLREPAHSVVGRVLGEAFSP